MIARPLVAVVAWAVLAGTSLAQQPRVSAFIEPREGIVELQRLEFVIQVESDRRVSLRAGRLGPLTRAKVVAGPSSFTETRWVNGRSDFIQKLTYSLQATSAGEAEIPPLQVQVGDRVYTTEPIRFSVGKTQAGVPPPLLPQGRATGRGASSQPAAVFLRASLEKEEVWVGQPVRLDVELYTAEETIGLDWSAQPSLANFWVEDFEVDKDASRTQRVVDGRRYLVLHLARKILVPQTPGKLEIGPFAVTASIRKRRSGDAFDFFGFGRPETLERKSQDLTLEVKPLPASGRPERFSGAVGQFELKLSLDRQDTTVNDALAVEAVVSGQGFLRAVTPPGLQENPDLKVFPPKATLKQRESRGRLVSTKTWEWVVVPLSPGELQLPDLEFNYFDPIDGAYRTLSARPEAVTVARGDAPVDAGPGRGDVQLVRRDLAFIKPLDGKLDRGSAGVHGNPLFLLLAALPVVWGPLVVLLGRHRARLQRNRGWARSRRARSTARKRLVAARRRVGETDHAGFHEEVARALVDYVADRFDRSSAGLTYDAVELLLCEHGVDDALRQRFRTCLESCDFARFVPSAGREGSREATLEEAIALVDGVEKAT